MKTESQSSIGERILQIIDFYHLNKNSFSVKLGQDSNSLIVKVTNDPTRTLGLEMLQKIVTAFPDVSIEWLVMGRGNMLSGPKFPDPTQHYINYYHGNSEKPADVMRIFGYEDCTAAFDVMGEVMSPKYRTGDIVICKEVSLTDPIAYGEAYMLFSYKQLLIRYIKGSSEPGKLKLTAENGRYEPVMLEAADIERSYIIKGVIRREVY